jgi:hypothetical protein
LFILLLPVMLTVAANHSKDGSRRRPPNGEGYQKTGLSVATYDDVMKGTKLGKVIIPGQSLNSSLNRLIEGRPGVDPSIQMPHGKVKLPEAQLIVLRKWVDQGAKNN